MPARSRHRDDASGVAGLRRDGTRLSFDFAVDTVRADGRELLTGVLRDLSAELVRQEELRRLRGMEAIGRLTAGSRTTSTTS